MSGYSLPFDEQYGNEFVLRYWDPAWYNGKECSVPLAPGDACADVDPYAPHQLSVTAQGDTLMAGVDWPSAFAGCADEVGEVRVTR